MEMVWYSHMVMTPFHMVRRAEQALHEEAGTGPRVLTPAGAKSRLLTQDAILAVEDAGLQGGGAAVPATIPAHLHGHALTTIERPPAAPFGIPGLPLRRKQTQKSSSSLDAGPLPHIDSAAKRVHGAKGMRPTLPQGIYKEALPPRKLARLARAIQAGRDAGEFADGSSQNACIGFPVASLNPGQARRTMRRIVQRRKTTRGSSSSGELCGAHGDKLLLGGPRRGGHGPLAGLGLPASANCATDTDQPTRDEAEQGAGVEHICGQGNTILKWGAFGRRGQAPCAAKASGGDGAEEPLSSHSSETRSAACPRPQQQSPPGPGSEPRRPAHNERLALLDAGNGSGTMRWSADARTPPWAHLPADGMLAPAAAMPTEQRTGDMIHAPTPKATTSMQSPVPADAGEKTRRNDLLPWRQHGPRPRTLPPLSRPLPDASEQPHSHQKDIIPNLHVDAPMQLSHVPRATATPVALPQRQHIAGQLPSNASWSDTVRMQMLHQWALALQRGCTQQAEPKQKNHETGAALLSQHPAPYSSHLPPRPSSRPSTILESSSSEMPLGLKRTRSDSLPADTTARLQDCIVAAGPPEHQAPDPVSKRLKSLPSAPSAALPSTLPQQLSNAAEQSTSPAPAAPELLDQGGPVCVAVGTSEPPRHHPTVAVGSTNHTRVVFGPQLVKMPSTCVRTATIDLTQAATSPCPSFKIAMPATSGGSGGPLYTHLPKQVYRFPQNPQRCMVRMSTTVPPLPEPSGASNALSTRPTVRLGAQVRSGQPQHRLAASERRETLPVRVCHGREWGSSSVHGAQASAAALRANEGNKEETVPASTARCATFCHHPSGLDPAWGSDVLVIRMCSVARPVPRPVCKTDQPALLYGTHEEEGRLVFIYKIILLVGACTQGTLCLPKARDSGFVNVNRALSMF